MVAVEIALSLENIMLKEIKNPTLEVTIDSTKSGLVDAFYTSKTESQFPDDEYELCYNCLLYTS